MGTLSKIQRKLERAIIHMKKLEVDDAFILVCEAERLTDKYREMSINWSEKYKKNQSQLGGSDAICNNSGLLSSKGALPPADTIQKINELQTFLECDLWSLINPVEKIKGKKFVRTDHIHTEEELNNYLDYHFDVLRNDIKTGSK